ncbi:unnamed protein product, partial [Ectocarpus sp. 8 AP-2014]
MVPLLLSLSMLSMNVFRWEELMEGSVLRWVPDRIRVSTHIVAFDMDGTLIKTKSGVV